MAATKCHRNIFNSCFAYTFNFECSKTDFITQVLSGHIPTDVQYKCHGHPPPHTHLHTPRPRPIYAPTFHLTVKKLHVLSDRRMVLKYPPIPPASEASTFCSWKWKGLHALQYNKTKTPYYNQFGSVCHLLSWDRERLTDGQTERERERVVCVWSGEGVNGVILDKFHILSSSSFFSSHFILCFLQFCIFYINIT